MKKASADEYRRNLVRLTAAWMLVLDESDISATEEFDMVAIRKAKDTLLSIEEEVIDYENEEEEKIDLQDDFVGCEPELLPVGLE